MAVKKTNIKKAQEKWQVMSKTRKSKSQPEGKNREKPGTTGEGKYYRIVVRPKYQFKTFRNQDVGDPGHIQRLAGKRESGSWSTQAWLISKTDAHIEGENLIPDTEDARKLINGLSSKPKRVRADVFEAKDRRNIPEKEKPTVKQKNARKENIERAQHIKIG